MNPHPESRTITFADLSSALVSGLQRFQQSSLISIIYSTLFTLIGLGLYIVLEAVKIAPISHSLAGGFMLFGPALLVGFFSISEALDAGRKPLFTDIFKGLRHSPPGLWGFSLLCLFLFFIWITEAATVYAFVVGTLPVGFLEMLPPDSPVTGFLLFTSLGGALLAFIAFVAAAFTPPLLIYTDAGMVEAVSASARAVFNNFGVMMVWALLLVVLVMGGAWFLPLLPLTLPLAAYASLALYQAVFEAEPSQPR